MRRALDKGERNWYVHQNMNSPRNDRPGNVSGMTEDPLTVRQWQKRVLETRKRLMEDRKRIWPEDETRTCPACKRKTLKGRSDLTREVHTTGAVIVFTNLHGAACDRCGTEYLEGYEQAAIEERAGTAFRAEITGSVSFLGGKKLGTYWPKGIQEALDLHPKDKLKITPLSPDTAAIRVIHEHKTEATHRRDSRPKK